MTRWAVPVTLVALTLTLLVLGVDRGLAWGRSAAHLDAGRAAVSTAEREVVTLLSVSASTSSADLARLRAGATGDFKSQLAEQASSFSSALSASQVSSRGTVVSAGLSSLSGARATVVLAATGTVSNKAAKRPSLRSYRLRAELLRTGGAWLVQSLEFVS